MKTVSRRFDMTYRLFTYGTLMKGEANHHYLSDDQFLYEAILKDYGLKEVGRYPAAVRMKDHQVFGEVYEVDEQTKGRIDVLEDVGVEYACRKVTVETDQGSEEVLFYEYLPDHSRLKLSSIKGKWHSSAD